MRCTTVFVLLLCLTSFLQAAESSPDADERGTENVKTHVESVLGLVEKAMRSALFDLGEEVTFEYAERSQSLTVKYRTRKFMVHGGSRAGFTSVWPWSGR
jgi:hypothetical protein